MSKRIFLLLGLFSLSRLFFPLPVIAGTDIKVICKSSADPCLVTPSSVPIFAEYNQQPGDSVTQTITLVNESQTNHCYPSLSITKDDSDNSGLDSRIITSISSGVITYFGTSQESEVASMAKLFSESAIELAPMPPTTTQEYLWMITLDPLMDNVYQGMNTSFTTKLAIECNDPISPTSSPSHNPVSQILGAVKSASAPVCTDQPSESSPQLQILRTAANQVTLSWTAVQPATHYALFFTRVSDRATYGNSNLGNVTEYTITNLQANEVYQFEVMGINGCAPGPRSNLIVSDLITGTVLNSAVSPIGEQGEVLGVTDNEDDSKPISEVLAGSIQGKVAGVSTCSRWFSFLPLTLLSGLTLLSLFYLLKTRRSLIWKKHVPLFLGYIGIAVFVAISQSCACQSSTLSSFVCNWYLVLVLVILISLEIINYLFIEEVSP